MTSDEIKNGTCLIIPTYNNEKTVQQVVEEVKQYHLHVILVNDGSTDRTHQLIKEMEVEWIEYPHNKGKGYALKQGFKRAVALGYRYAITIDSDGQHYASDIPKFLDAVAQHPDNLIVGSRFLNTENMPSANSFCQRI
ncbi:MAG: glycosyltransferase family 2 protein [Bacteroidales bacterium]